VLSAYVFGNISLLFHSASASPTIPPPEGGARKNYCYQLLPHGRDDVLRGEGVLPVHGRARRGDGARTTSTATISDHGARLSSAGSRFACGHADGRPDRIPPGAIGHAALGPRNGRTTANWYHHPAANIAVSGSNYGQRNNYLDLDPT